MPSRTFNAPLELLQLAKGHDASRCAVLAAAMRAVCEAPPPAPVSYPTLTTAVGRVTLPLSADLHGALRVAEARYFYGRTAWLCFYALVHRARRVGELVRLDAEALARLDASVYAHLVSTSEVTPWIVPLSTRAPRAPKASAKRT